MSVFPLPTMKRLFLLLALIPLAAAFAAEDPIKARLEKSPRHLEWVTVKHGARELKCFVAYPEVKEKATAVVVIHEIFGLSDWVRGFVDQLAEAGYIAIAPDFLSGAGPNGGGTESFPGGDGVRQKISGLPADQITADLNAAVAYVGKLPAANGKVAVAGFCWGGGQAFRYAATGAAIQASLVFYGPAPKPEEMKGIKAPIFGFYGGNDARITAAVPDVTTQMKQAGKAFDPVVYDAAGHGFMRAGEAADASEPNRKGRDAGWVRVREILKRL